MPSCILAMSRVLGDTLPACTQMPIAVASPGRGMPSDRLFDSSERCRFSLKESFKISGRTQAASENESVSTARSTAELPKASVVTRVSKRITSAAAATPWNGGNGARHVLLARQLIIQLVLRP